jgi:hypothetical protein
MSSLAKLRSLERVFGEWVAYIFVMFNFSHWQEFKEKLIGLD